MRPAHLRLLPAPLLSVAALLSGCSAGVATSEGAAAVTTPDVGHASVAELLAVLERAGTPCEGSELVQEPLAEEASRCTLGGEQVALVHFVDAEQAREFAARTEREGLHAALATSWAAITPTAELAEQVGRTLGAARVV